MATAPVTTTTTLTGVLTDQTGATFNVTLTSTPKAVTPPPPPPPPPTKESPDLTWITKPGGTFIDATGGTWTITAGLQLTRSGVLDPVTANVVGVGISNHVVYQTNKDGGWWSGTINKWTSVTGNPGFKIATPPVPPPPPPPPPPLPSTGTFNVSNGQIIDPTGKVWVGKGINVADWAAVGGGGPGNVGNGTKTVDGSGNPQNGMDGQFIFSLFPNCNLVRLNCESFLAHDASGYNDSPDSIRTFVNNLTARKCVVVIDDHAGSNPTIPQGTGTTQQSWWRTMAAAFASNPYVWYGTINEPWGHDTADVICQNQLDTYNTLRGAGVTAPILLEITNPPAAWGASWEAPQAHFFSTMKNVVWDSHIYGGAQGSAQSQDANNAAIAGAVAAVHNNGITSQDGKIPVIIGEYGPSSTDSDIDPNGTQNIIAVLTAAVNGTVPGTISWTWQAGNWNVQNQGFRTNYGNVVNDAFNGNLGDIMVAVTN